MNTSLSGQSIHARLAERRDGLADSWRRAVARTSYVPLSAAELREQFALLAEQAISTLDSDTDADEIARQIGRSLVALGYAAPEALGQTQAVLSLRLRAGLESEDVRVLEPGLARLLAGVAAGFTYAARERILAEQEATHSAVLVENRRAGEALRHQAALLDLAPDGIIVRTLEARTLFWNRGAEVMYGWSRKEAMGQTPHELLHTKFPRPLSEIEQQVVELGHWEGELVHTCRDGSTIIVASRWALQAEDEGHPRAILEINTDITARKEIEATLRQREASLETAQSMAHLGSWEWYPANNVGFWTPELYRLLGYPEGHAEPTPEAFLRAVHPEDQGRLARAIEETFRGRPSIVEHRVVGSDGTERIVQSRSDVERDANGMPLRFFGTVLDVTERRRVEAERLQLLAEQAARVEAEAAQERFAFLAEASTRLASSLDYEVTLRNVAELAVPTLADACTVDMMLEDGQVRRVATTSGDLAPDDELDRAWTPDVAPQPLVTVLNSGRSALYPDLNAVDGEVPPALHAMGIRSMMVVPLLARGRVLGAITCFGFAGRPAYSSIEQALAEELGRRCGLAIDNARLHAEAQRATRLRDEFLSVAAHELKTPMTTLRGYAQLLGRALLGGEAPTPALLARSVQAIDAQSEKLVTLTEQLLDVSRIEAGKLRLERRSVDLVQLVGGIVAAIQETTDRHVLTFTAPAETALRVDPMRLEQVVSNLVGNAVKYSPQGGPISIVLERREPGGVRLEVRDWGLGIPPERRESLFDRFYQAHGDGYFGGLGLGLYVSKQIVELHGGSIEAEFPNDGGCRFVVTLPEATASSRDAA